MSILIKGMEMPTTGLYLVSVDSSCGKDETVMTVKRMLGNRDVCLIIGAYNLVPVPPHGRLIDADALMRFIKSAIERHRYGELKLERGLTVKDVLDAVIADLEGSGVDGFANAPTIIPAEEGE